jgi:hypothetical protein
MGEIAKEWPKNPSLPKKGTYKKVLTEVRASDYQSMCCNIPSKKPWNR